MYLPSIRLGDIATMGHEMVKTTSISPDFFLSKVSYFMLASCSPIVHTEPNFVAKKLAVGLPE